MTKYTDEEAWRIVESEVRRRIAKVRRATREATILQCAAIAHRWNVKAREAILALLPPPTPPAAEPVCKRCDHIRALHDRADVSHPFEPEEPGHE